ncbi:MAG: NAD(+) synthase, partial [Firmicutes bacterium]|nr:NAD(+) synthase [Bacillota bacterium]
AGCGESTMDDVYDGRCLLAENGNVIGDSGMLLREGACCTAAFGQNAPQPVLLKKPYEYAARDPFIPAGEEDAEEFCSEILQAQAVALAERLQRSYSGKAIIGVSGGSDSTLSILASARAMELLGKPSSDVLAVTMPGFGTSSRTKGNAYGMMEALGCEIREISIAASVAQHFKDIDHDINDHNVTYENAQARERTQILMDLANRDGGLVVGTGDMSEEALGWCTYNGDHMAMYNTNASLTKGLVKKVIAVAAKQLRSGTSPFSNEKDALKLAAALEDVLDTPVSPELLPTDENGQIAQKTEDKVGPYELHDFFLFHLVNDGMDPDDILDLAETAFAGSYDRATIAKWLKTFCRRFFTQQFKRNCAPEGAQLIAMSLSPRGAWAMPSDADGSLWLQLRE